MGMGDIGMIGKWLVGLGGVLVFLGVLCMAMPKLFGGGALWAWIGHLPGDILIKKENFTLYFPIATSLIVSVVLTLLFTILSKR